MKPRISYREAVKLKLQALADLKTYVNADPNMLRLLASSANETFTLISESTDPNDERFVNILKNLTIVFNSALAKADTESYARERVNHVASDESRSNPVNSDKKKKLSSRATGPKMRKELEKREEFHESEELKKPLTIHLNPNSEIGSTKPINKFLTRVTESPLSEDDTRRIDTRPPSQTHSQSGSLTPVSTEEKKDMKPVYLNFQPSAQINPSELDSQRTLIENQLPQYLDIFNDKTIYSRGEIEADLRKIIATISDTQKENLRLAYPLVKAGLLDIPVAADLDPQQKGLLQAAYKITPELTDPTILKLAGQINNIALKKKNMAPR